MTLAENLKTRRKEYELTQEDLAKRVGVDRVSISNFEAGLKVPSLNTTVAIADALHMSIDELIGRQVS